MENHEAERADPIPLHSHNCAIWKDAFLLAVSKQVFNGLIRKCDFFSSIWEMFFYLKKVTVNTFKGREECTNRGRVSVYLFVHLRSVELQVLRGAWCGWSGPQHNSRSVKTRIRTLLSLQGLPRDTALGNIPLCRRA